ncbi:MAG: glycosyltransferase family A protein [Synechococcales bacterium]|nr:glycosyltransferase family A protein [Synechococcales bacterium]
MVSFGTIICTYNRQSILEKALAHWQSSIDASDQFLVVDASPNAESSRQKMLDRFPQLFKGSGSDYIVSNQPGLTRQRNLGLKYLTTDITCFVDDDTFITPTYVDRIRQIFQADTQKMIGGVNGVAKGQFDNWQQRYTRLGRNYLRHQFGNWLGQRIHIPHHSTQRHQPLPPELNHFPLIHIDRLWGANMNYRTELIQSQGFDENFQRYGLYEDVEMSARVGKTHKLVCCLDAEIEHDETLGQSTRPNDARYFLASWANSAYIIEKLFPCPESRLAHRRYFDVFQLVSKLAPRPVADRKFRSLGNSQLLSQAQDYIHQIQQCQTPETLSDTFVQIQLQILSYSA